MFTSRKNEGPDKLVGLEEAIGKHLRPGMVLHLGDSSNAIVRQILRHFWGTQPDFTVIASRAEDYVLDMVHVGQVKKLIFGLCSESYPTRSPSKIMQRAFQENSIQMENWSLHTIVQRLMAGAMGLQIMPTKSLKGSTTADENAGFFLEMDDPFGSGQRLGLVKSLHPDLSFIHGLAADRAGNVIPASSASSGQGVWGALGSKEGVLVTAEKIVSTDFIRRYSHLAQIPGHLVRSVSLAPRGAHPQGLYNLGVTVMSSYGADYEFMQEHRRSTRSREDLDAWIEDWIPRCPSHETYLEKLGTARLNALTEACHSRPLEMREKDTCSADRPHNITERMIVIAAREIIERLNEAEYFTILTGTGVSMLASWLAYYQIRERRPAVQRVKGAGLFGYTPHLGEPQRTGSVRNMRTAKMISDASHMYGVFVGGQNNRCISVLGAGQIDKQGNMNTSRLPGKVFLISDGGASDAINAREVLVVSYQSKERFVERVPYITCSGKNVRTLVSDRGLLEKQGEGEEFVLTGYFALAKDSCGLDEIAQIKNECGWNLRVSQNVREIAPPHSEENTLLRTLDPKGLFIRN